MVDFAGAAPNGDAAGAAVDVAAGLAPNREPEAGAAPNAEVAGAREPNGEGAGAELDD